MGEFKSKKLQALAEELSKKTGVSVDEVVAKDSNLRNITDEQYDKEIKRQKKVLVDNGGEVKTYTPYTLPATTPSATKKVPFKSPYLRGLFNAGVEVGGGLVQMGADVVGNQQLVNDIQKYKEENVVKGNGFGTSLQEGIGSFPIYMAGIVPAALAGGAVGGPVGALGGIATLFGASSYGSARGEGKSRLHSAILGGIEGGVEALFA